MLNIQQIAKTDATLLPTLLKSIEDNRVFKKVEFRDSFVKNINNLLNLRESRSSALSTLNIFCDHHLVNSSLVTEKTSPEINWIDQLLRIIEQEPNISSQCFEILAKLIRITSANPDTNKIVQSKYVQKIIDAITTSTTPAQSLQCLATCFELHGGTSGIYKNKILEYCVSFVDVPNSEIAELAALCLHLIQQSRGGSVAGGVYKKCWAEFHERTLGSLENLLDQITKKTGGNIGKSEKLQLPDLVLSPEPFDMYTQLFVRFQNVVTILRVSLRHSFATTKVVQVSRVISLVEEGIGMSQVLLGKKAIADSVVLSLLHGQIHVNLLNILTSLIVTLKQNIIPHSKTICDILWRCLKQTNAHEQLKFAANLKLRAATYDAFICFIRISPNNVFVKNVMENLMKEALVDVTPANNEVCLMMPQSNGGKSNKKRKLDADKKFGKGRIHVVNLSDEQQVCRKALKCLGFLLVYHGVLMKPVLFFVMQEKIASIGFAITSRAQQDGDLYRDPRCRSTLSDLIGFLMMHPVHKMPVPINYGIALLTQMKNSDSDSNVRNAAAMNLLRAETAIHNRKDVFYFPVDYRDLRDTLMFNMQTIQKLNGATISTEKQTVISEVDMKSDLIIEDVAEEQKEAIVEVSDNESIDEIEIVEPVKNGTVKPTQDKQAELNEISDDDVEEISESEKITSPIKQVSKIEKRPTKDDKIVPVKKVKISKQKDEELLAEYLADFKS